ncbi:MAG: seryl-tRNA synthetase [Bacteriovoracaceae bacterium]|nr:seryl-tRNA synthetase [Bacteriovoracaceae bacterium]
MFDLKQLAENFEVYEAGWKKRNSTSLSSQIDSLRSDLQKRKKLIQAHEELLAARNKATQEIAQKKKSGQDVTSDVQQQRQIGDKIKSAQEELEVFQTQFEANLSSLPNIPHSSVPVGTSAEGNVEVARKGKTPTFDFEPISHEILGEKRGWFDFNQAAKITGARFSVSKGFAAKLERVLIQFMLDIHTTEHGYTEVIPPFIVNDRALYGTGNLPKFKEDLFKLENHPFFLIPTSEVPLTNLHAETEVKFEDLPKYYTAYSPCFRSEAGSYGKDLKGLIRQHQFNKVELVKVVHPETSYDEHEKMRTNAERILELLELPYRTMLLCTGDMGFASSKTYDLEVWLPSQKAYREISSISNCEAFQARRMSARFRDKDGKLKFVHTLNGSGLAVGRTLIAILENYQNKDLKVTIPKVLRPYFSGQEAV